jgi:PAS domain S-box-containing protein
LATVCISALERVDSAARPASFTPLMDSKSPRASQSSGLDAGTRLPTLDMLLAPSEERFRLLVESVKDYGIFMLDLRGTVVSWNQGAERISGYTASDIVGRHFSIFYPPEEIARGRPECELEAATEQGRFEEQVWRLRKDGSRYWSEVVITPLHDGRGELAGFAKVTRDLTEREQAESAARRHSVVFDTIGDGVLVMDLDGRITDMNPAAEALFGYDKGDLVGRLVVTLHHPSLGGKREEMIQASLRRDGRWSGELPFQRKDGSEGVADVVVVAQRDEFGTPNAWIGVNRDITARRRAEERLAESRALLADAEELAHVGSWALTVGSTSITWSDELYRIMGLAPQSEGITRESFLARVHPDDRSLVHQAFVQLHEKGEAPPIEFRIIRPDGTERVIQARGRAHRDDVGRIMRLIGSAQDVTDRVETEREYRRLEEQLRQSQKMEAIGQLAGGVAHDFNNLLTVIKAYSGMVVDRLDESNPLRSDVVEIQRAAGRAASLTQQLLAFSRKQTLQPRILDLNVVSRELEPMMRRLITDDIQIVVRQAAAIGRVKADPVQIEQVLINLVVNARDAMPSGGVLTIETANAELDEAYQGRHAVVVPGSYVMVAVSDSGIGMDAMTRSRIFEPFFTTKAPGKGTGLGLSTVYGIVKQSSGYIWVYSEPGLGTTFKMYLPRLEEDEITAATAEQAVIAPLAGSEIVLLVEDEPAVRSLARRILERNGYTVLEAHDGPDALRVADQYKQPIQLLVTDMMMPELSGRDVWMALRSKRAELRVLFMSGYTNDDMIRRGLLDQGAAFLQKPFTAADLARAARTVLDARS